eukprot:6563540-Pyramimonas_sp.AAC.1
MFDISQHHWVGEEGYHIVWGWSWGATAVGVACAGVAAPRPESLSCQATRAVAIPWPASKTCAGHSVAFLPFRLGEASLQPAMRKQ